MSCWHHRYEGKLYGFSSKSALLTFIELPELVLDGVQAAVRAQPLLLHLLGLDINNSIPSSSISGYGGCSTMSISGAGSAWVSEPGTTAAAAEGGSLPGQQPSASGKAAAGDQEGSKSGAGASEGSNGGAAYSGADSAAGGGAGGNIMGGASSSGVIAHTAGRRAGVVPSLRELVHLLGRMLLKVEVGTQTPTHFVERHVDVNYEWNEWALRRRVSGMLQAWNRHGEMKKLICHLPAALTLQPQTHSKVASPLLLSHK